MTDDLQAVIEQDLYKWGDWARRDRVIQGYGESAIGRISKAETKNHAVRRRVVESETLHIQYDGGRAVAAQYGKGKISIPVQEITAPSTRENPWTVKKTDENEEIAMEIDGYMATLERIRPLSYEVGKHKYWFQRPREVSVKDLGINKDEYHRLVRDVINHIQTCRAVSNQWVT